MIFLDEFKTKLLSLKISDFRSVQITFWAPLYHKIIDLSGYADMA